MKYKVLNLLLPYIFFSLISIVISLLIPAWRKFTLKSLFIEYLYNVNPSSFHIGQIWFLFALVDIMIFIFISQYIFENEICILGFSFICFIIAYLIKDYGIGIYHYGHNYRIPFKLDDAFAGFLFFYAGFYINKKNILKKIESLDKIYKTIIILVTLAIFIVSVYLNGMVNLDCNYNKPIFYLVSSFSGIFLTYFISCYVSRTKLYFLKYLGKNSLPIFAVHSYPIFLYCYILSKLNGFSKTMMHNVSVLESFVCLFFVVILCLLFVIPYNRYVKLLFLRINNKIKNEQ